jgi:hypothetical protein
LPSSAISTYVTAAAATANCNMRRNAAREREREREREGSFQDIGAPQSTAMKGLKLKLKKAAAAVV